MEITQVYSTRRSIRYSTRGQGQSLSFSLVPALETVDGCLLPPAPKKKARTLYSTGKLSRPLQPSRLVSAECSQLLKVFIANILRPAPFCPFFCRAQVSWSTWRLCSTRIITPTQRRERSSPHRSVSLLRESWWDLLSSGKLVSPWPASEMGS